jgi:hypothetical protein
MKESKFGNDQSANKPSEPVAERPGKAIQAVVDRWYTNKLSDPVSRSSEEAGDQVLDAVVKLADQIAGASRSIAARDSAIDDWFVKHFHKAPVSEDTRLYNTLHAAKEELKAMLSADE